MAPSRPTLKQLFARISGDISSRTEGSAFLPRSVEQIFAYVLSGVAHGVHGYLDWLRAQLLPTRAAIEGLLEWGDMLDLARNPAEAAELSVQWTGTNGTVVTASNQLVQAKDGTLFTLISGGTVAGGTVTCTVRSALAGTAGNLDAGAKVSFVTPIAGIDSEGTVLARSKDGVEVEDVEAYRARVLDDLRQPPKGGGPGDYVKWAKEVAGVTRGWEFSNRMGYGTVSLAFVRDNDASIIPDAGEVAAVQAHIDSVKPLDMRAAYVVAAIAKPVNATIKLSPNTAAVQTAVTNELKDLFKREAQLETAIAQSKFTEAISTAVGEDKHELVSISSLVPGTWELLTLGSLTFQSF